MSNSNAVGTSGVPLPAFTRISSDGAMYTRNNSKIITVTGQLGAGRATPTQEFAGEAGALSAPSTNLPLRPQAPTDIAPSLPASVESYQDRYWWDWVRAMCTESILLQRE